MPVSAKEMVLTHSNLEIALILKSQNTHMHTHTRAHSDVTRFSPLCPVLKLSTGSVQMDSRQAQGHAH